MKKPQIGEKYKLIEFGHTRVYIIISKEEANKNRGQEFVDAFKDKENYVFTFEASSRKTQAWKGEILLKEGVKI